MHIRAYTGHFFQIRKIYGAYTNIYGMFLKQLIRYILGD